MKSRNHRKKKNQPPHVKRSGFPNKNYTGKPASAIRKRKEKGEQNGRHETGMSRRKAGDPPTVNRRLNIKETKKRHSLGRGGRRSKTLNQNRVVWKGFSKLEVACARKQNLVETRNQERAIQPVGVGIRASKGHPLTETSSRNSGWNRRLNLSKLPTMAEETRSLGMPYTWEKIEEQNASRVIKRKKNERHKKKDQIRVIAETLPHEGEDRRDVAASARKLRATGAACQNTHQRGPILCAEKESVQKEYVPNVS